jgi:copper oxidase (laccase) domain-containing protein
MEAFRKSSSGLECFDLKTVGKWRLDLAAANYRQLLAAGLSEINIETTPLCVSCEHDLFFSYRRDSGETGRQMGFIKLK